MNFLNLNLLTPQDLCCCSSGATEGKRRAAAHSVATGLSSVCLGPTMYYYIRTMATFVEFLSKKYLRQISILGTNNEKIIKSKGSFVISILKVDITLVLLFFLIFQLLVPKIEIFFSTIFWTKTHKNGHCGTYYSSRGKRPRGKSRAPQSKEYSVTLKFTVHTF